jgi:CRISPR-associated protein Csx17
LKLLFLPGGVRIDDDPIVIRYEPSIIPLLRSGRINDACTIAGRRLRTTGFMPITATFPDGRDGVRMAAALLLPVRGEQKLMKLVLKPKVKQP